SGHFTCYYRPDSSLAPDRMTIRLPLLAACCLLLTGSTHAQSEDASLVLDEEALLFEEIPSVFGASKYEQKTTEAPAFVSIVTADEIARYGYRTLADILGATVGFYSTQDRSYAYQGVRGFGIPGDYNSRILLTIDGHRTNDNVYDSAMVGPTFHLDLDLVERVEIVRGPSSSIYGSNAFFAVVNVITRRGRDMQGVEVAGTLGSHDTRQGRLSYGNSFGNGLEVLVSGTLFRSDGDDDLYYPEFDDPSSNDGHAEDSDEDRFGSLFGELSFQDFTLQGSWVNRKKEVPTAAWGTVFNSGDDENTDKTYYLLLKYDHSFADLSRLSAKVSYNGYEYDGDYIYDWDETEDGSEPYLVPNRDGAEGRWWGAEGQYDKRFFEDHRVGLGGEYRDNFQIDQWNYDQDGADRYDYLDSQKTSTIWALYAQDEWSITESLILNGGVRYDHYSTFGGTTNPRVALIYNPLVQTTLKLLYGQAFRAPNAYELYYDDGELETQKANPDLDPETIRTYEVVWEQGIGAHLRSVVSGFYYDIEDLIVITEDPADELLVFENVAEVKTRGLEVELNGHWANGLQGRINYSYHKAEDADTDQWLVNSPKHLAKFNLTVPVWTDTLFGSVETQYSGKRKTPQGGTADAYWTTNLGLLARTELGSWLQGLEFSATVYNLFDESYDHPGSAEHEQDVLEQDGRTFRVKAVARF
ncbi:MAG: TonB-dependent receptor, partial [Deferrisomatales bacterium]|nr:TonB-dependent receptor [Deferrisomatales bacterium]